MGAISGEGHYDVLDQAIGQLVERHKAKGELEPDAAQIHARDGAALQRPAALTPARYSPTRPASGCSSPTPAITGSSRPTWTVRTRSRSAAARRDLTTAICKKATFNRPQGMCLDGETLYVADTENHAIRAVDLKDANVTTIAGIGSQSARVFRRRVLGPAQDNRRFAARGTSSSSRATRRSTSRWPGRTRSGSSISTPDMVERFCRIGL